MIWRGKEILGQSFLSEAMNFLENNSFFSSMRGGGVGWKIISSLYIILGITVGTRQHGTTRVRGLCLSPDGSEIRRSRLCLTRQGLGWPPVLCLTLLLFAKKPQYPLGRHPQDVHSLIPADLKID